MDSSARDKRIHTSLKAQHENGPEFNINLEKLTVTQVCSRISLCPRSTDAQ
eukprot:CAMPEP_0202890788 /NCGR_PEP_ID=MMETSP1392-20130828/1088_1 /ASSEMBLY_ACC=CAM_ASM_000868 /TAXON_ID=225041 /ORGANISM="Chlamydomonas chlamydogama, Strain SAG 11-48b" /LENGTH=50 /DNA_ID=CAMNT_0049574425 /DNA_START=271 /DNA_END=423 /DNA_ORIENTATION=-